MKIDIKDFKEYEFICKCGCGYNDYKEEDVLKLQLLRTMCGFSLFLNSCCRCKIHNKKEGGKEKSEHLECQGFDIRCLRSDRRFILIECALRLGFKRIGIYKDFVHLGTSKTHVQNRLWYG
ncbi:MAG: zinc D-Ala-D-Ala carboxypeptidase [Sulfurimonas sp.]|jgi:zinc D-Ala-D-Ala carboxypeptidase